MTSRLLIICSCRQQAVEKMNIPAMGYGKSGLFIYRVTHLLPGGSILNVDTLALFCSGVAMKDVAGQNASQWKTLTKDTNGKYTLASSYAGNSVSGIIANDTMLFIHPPRYGQYRVLEFCPFPLYYPHRKDQFTRQTLNRL